MKKKYIVLISIAICICTVVLVIMQGISLRAAGEIQKEDFHSKMEEVLDFVVNNAEILEEDNESSQNPIMESFGTKSYSSFLKSKSSISSLTSITTENKIQQRFSMSKNDIKYAKTDPTMRRILEGSIGAIGRDMQIKKDINVDDNQPYDITIESITQQKITVDVPVEARVTKSRIDSLIKIGFKSHNIKTAYEYAITSPVADSVSNVHSADFRSDRPERLYSKQMFPTDSELAKKYFLNIYVPHLSDYIFREMSVVIISSIILILIIISTFAATLIIIFRQKRLSKMRSDFMGNMTHELKTPIATITLAAEMLQDPNVPTEKKNVAGLSKMVRDESQRLSSLVEKVLRMAAFERGNINLKHKDVDINHLVHRAVDTYSLQFKSKNVKIAATYDAKNAIVTGDEMHLLQIISNLIDNALKYSKDNPELKITTTNSNNGIIIAVQDNGIGIEKEYQKHVFEQFYRVPTGNIHAVKGSGLGLNYVKQIAEMHGGRVWVESEKGKGSTFSIYLPNKIEKK